MTQKLELQFDNNDLVAVLFGAGNANLDYIEKKTGATIANRGNHLTLSGSKSSIKKTRDILESLWTRIKDGEDIGPADIDARLRFMDNEKTNDSSSSEGENVNAPHGKVIKTKRKSIVPRSPGQAEYLKAIDKHEMVFGLGPAGTGKTYLAVAAGVSLYLQGKVERLIFTRPAIEAGERLGFLPGDMQEKIDPYLRPIYDALQDMMPTDFMINKMEAGEIEVAPLAFMRGRTLSNAFVILDEAQNTTSTQMKMFLTRMGEATRMVITGDITQTDLPPGVKSGLRDALEVLDGVTEIRFHRFSNEDVVRHHLVGKILHAYDQKK